MAYKEKSRQDEYCKIYRQRPEFKAQAAEYRERAKAKKRGKIIVDESIPKGLIGSEPMMAKFFCSMADLVQFRNQGMPYVKVRGRCYYDLEACQKWYRGERYEN